MKQILWNGILKINHGRMMALIHQLFEILKYIINIYNKIIWEYKNYSLEFQISEILLTVDQFSR